MTGMCRKHYDKQIWTQVQTQQAQLVQFNDLFGKAKTRDSMAGEGQNQVISLSRANKSKWGTCKSKETGKGPKTR